MTDDPVLHALVDLVRAVECYPSPPMNGPAYKNALAVIRERTGMQPEVGSTIENAERYRWLRDECTPEQRIVIAEYADRPDLLDHHIDKGRCGL